VTAITWQRTPDRNVWRATCHGLTLTVCKLTSGQWQPVVERGNVAERALTPKPTRLAAQAWCENRAGGAK
jgi:hypothetical protein